MQGLSEGTTLMAFLDGTTSLSGVQMKKSFALFALLAACMPAEDNQEPNGKQDRPEVNCATVDLATPSDAAQAVADANNAFAVDMYAQVADRAESNQNLFFSPFSITSAVGMTLAGAEGETEAQMREVFHVGDDEMEHHLGYGELHPLVFGKAADCETTTLNMANRLFGQTGYPWLDGFLDVSSLDYGAELEELDFVSDPDGARVHINDWVADQTEDRIEDLLPSGALTSATRLVLANAIYFDANWDQPFEQAMTANSSFTRGDGSTVTTPLMFQEIGARSAVVDGIMAVELDYDGGAQSMVVMMPQSTEGQPASAFDGALIDSIEDELALAGDVWLGLPRFSFTQDTDLKSVLTDLGMVDAFNEAAANFNGMADASFSESLYISGAFHKAFISVDEAGTEAAAATAVVVGTESAPALNFIADRPFEFYIRDNSSGTILFMGRVQDPTTN